MSNSRAIAAVTATLRNLLHKQVPLVDDGLGGLAVTTDPLDLARKTVTGLQINLFLYQLVVNAALASRDPPQARPGESAPPALALDLRFLVTAYGSGESDNQALGHRVLGGAMIVLHDHPVLGREEIQMALGDVDPGEQIERIRITPLPLSVEDISKLWTTFQTPYRASAAYDVSVVLIDSRRPARAPLPVLARGEGDRGPVATAQLAPLLAGVELPHGQSAIRLGERFGLVGEHLSVADSELVFTGLRLDEDIVLPPSGIDESGALRVLIPDAPADPDALSRWCPGPFTVGLRRGGEGDAPPLSSNAVPIAIAPRITIAPGAHGVGTVQLTVECAPRIREGQRVVLIFADRQVAPVNIVNPITETEPTLLSFSIPKVETPGSYLVRLRVDGVDSIPVVRTGDPPVPGFDPAQRVVVT